MSEDNLAAVMHRVDDLRIDSVPVPELGDDQVLLKMDSVGICGSDVHFLKKGRIGDFVVADPMILGHEGSGIVARCGKKVDHLKPGDRVAIEPQYTCFKCEDCKTGRYNLCKDVRFCATPPVDGILQHFYAHPASFCFKLPDNMSMEEGALVEPTAVAVHACRRGKVDLGKTVLVCGAGPIGLVNMMTAKAFGATEVVITDLDRGRLEVAKSLGADGAYLIEAGKGPEEAAEEITKLFANGRKPDVSIECSGVEASIKTGIYATRPGGKLVQVGVGATEVMLPIVIASTREIDLIGIFRYVNCYPAAISMISSGKVNVKPLVTHRFNLKESVDAFETSRLGKGGAIKVMIKCEK